MTAPVTSTRAPRAVFPESAVLNAQQLADAIGVSVDTIEKMDLPCFYAGTRTKRYVWRQVLAILEERARAA